ncbi:MAG: recombinase RecT [Rhodoferax sp.]
MSSQALKAVATGAEQAVRLADMKPKEQIAYLLKTKQGEIAKMLPKHLNADRLLKVAQIAATTTPALAKCDVASLVGAIGQCAQMGLEPNTVLGHAYLVPFNTKRKDGNGNERWVNSVQVIIGYKGLIDLARRSGQIVSIAAHEVCENDKFELVYGLDEKLIHTPSLGERGQIIGFYAVAKLRDGGHCFEFMSVRQINEIRDASQGYQQAVKYKKQDSHPWGAHFTEMGRKTVIRRLAKYLPLSIEFQTAAALDSMAEGGKDQHLDTLDGDFAVVPDDAPYTAGSVDEETGEVHGYLAEQAPVQVPPPRPNQLVEESGANWEPSPQEQAAIQAREMAEAAGQQVPHTRTRRERGQGGLGLE